MGMSMRDRIGETLEDIRYIQASWDGLESIAIWRRKRIAVLEDLLTEHGIPIPGDEEAP